MALALLIIALGWALMGGVVYPVLAPPKTFASKPGGMATADLRARYIPPSARIRLPGYVQFGLAAAGVIALTAAVVAVSTLLFGEA